MGLIYALGVRAMNFMILFLVIILIPGLPPRTTFPFKEFSVAPVRELKGSLELNSHLDGGERLLDGKLYGPECLIARKNEIYTGIQGGEVIKLTSDHVTHVAKFGQPCEDIYEEHRCGRPLGLAFDTLGNNLIVADSYYGIWQVDLTNGKKKLLISPQQKLNGKVSRIAKVFNSVAVDRSGNIYWTDSSSDFSLEDIVYSIFANPSGRLFYYDRVKNTSKLLMDELFFANGVALSPNEEFVVVAETGASRLMKYHIKGAKAGTHEVFVDGLPGNPDNLTPDEEGIWIPLVTARDVDHPSAFTILSEFPSLRLFIVRMIGLFEMPFRYLNNAFPNKIAQKFLHFTGHAEGMLPFLPKRSTIVRVDWNGNILGSLHGFDRSVGHVSHVLELDDHLYLGSPYNRFLARVKSPKSPQVKIRNVRYEGLNMEPVITPKINNANTNTPKVVTTTPKPTTTTPIPTTTTPKTTTTTQKPSTTTESTTTTTKPTTTTPKPTTTTPKSTTTTPKPTTTTPKPTTTTTKPTPSTQTTPKPTTTTTTSKPTATSKSDKQKPTVKSTAPPSPSKTGKPKTTTPRVPPKNPAPITEKIADDTKAPQPQKLKVIKKDGEHIEL